MGSITVRRRLVKKKLLPHAAVQLMILGVEIDGHPDVASECRLKYTPIERESAKEPVTGTMNL